MSRKTVTYTVKDEGRDQGKVFLLTEMAAAKADRWAIKSLFAIAKGGVVLPEGAVQSGFASLARLGLGMFYLGDEAMALPLIFELMDCVQIIPEPSHPAISRPLIESDILEAQTFDLLRTQVFELHASFFQQGGKSTLASDQAAKNTVS